MCKLHWDSIRHLCLWLHHLLGNTLWLLVLLRDTIRERTLAWHLLLLEALRLLIQRVTIRHLTLRRISLWKRALGRHPLYRSTHPWKRSSHWRRPILHPRLTRPHRLLLLWWRPLLCWRTLHCRRRGAILFLRFLGLLLLLRQFRRLL
jgi:hypothetical protein